MQEISGISTMNIIGGSQKIARITPKLSKMNDYGLSLIEMKQALEKSTSQYLVGPLRERSKEPILVAGSFISNIEDIKSIPLGRRSGGTVVLSDIADVSIDYDKEKAVVFHTDAKNHQSQNAITVEFTKKKGTNATLLAESLKKKLDQLGPEIKDKNIAWEITRDYGQTAKEKTTELIEHLLLATLSVMILVAFVLGFRVSLVVGITVPVTLAMTILVYYLLGYTLNRVTLFALIFSIGILVDDAIVVVENIYSHIKRLAIGRNR
jgi:multidrug efflux pump subunit AcrB